MQEATAAIVMTAQTIFALMVATTLTEDFI
jgi:hypothetical protein